MTEKINHPFFLYSPEVVGAIAAGSAIVALESTVITHGLPYPENLHLALDMEAEIRAQGAVPATIAVLDGKVKVGMTPAELERLAQEIGMLKVSLRDFSAAIAFGKSGGTTVAGTLAVAHAAGFSVFATGGIGGVHRQAPFDISPDLEQLAQTPLVVVCAGAKAILDLPATIEVLETKSVPVVGYCTAEFPAFYARSSGLPVSVRADSPLEVVSLARAHWGMGFRSAVLVAQPVPEDSAMPGEFVEEAIRLALREFQKRGITGQAVTPFLLRRVSELSGGSSLRANLALLRNNARLGAQIALEMVKVEK